MSLLLSSDFSFSPGGCYTSGKEAAKRAATTVDRGPWDTVPDTERPYPEDSTAIAIRQMLKHKSIVASINPHSPPKEVEAGIQAALSNMIRKDPVAAPPSGTAAALRYIRDRINVPRDMPLHAARLMRQALEETAALDGETDGEALPIRHRRDQNPVPFRKTT